MENVLLIQLAATVIKAVFILLLLLQMVPVMIWAERKVSAFIQDRPGPNRAHLGPIRLFGMVHVIADAIKLFAKEDIVPREAHKGYFLLAPFIVTMVALMTFAVVPFADVMTLPNGLAIPMQILTADFGLLWFFAVASLGVYGIVLAGWASNNKYSLMGGIRATAQMISYEIPLGLSVIGILMIFGTVQLNEIVRQQGQLLFGFLPMWGIFLQPLGFIIFLVAAFAETNRAPFDLAESESELVAGYHTEYSSMKFGMFFFAEYIAMLVSAAFIVTLFLGGWQIPYLPTDRLYDPAVSGVVVKVLLAGTAVLLGLATVGLLSVYQNDKGHYNDIRDKEGLILAVITGPLALLFVVAFVAFSMATMPAWAPAVVAAVAQFSVFFLKLLLVAMFFVWVRWTVPRFRYDQLMNLGWKSLLPLALANVFITGLVILLIQTVQRGA